MLFIGLILVLLLPQPIAAAELGLPPALLQAVAEHERLEKARQEVTAARQRVRESRGDWYPELDVSAQGGWEKQDRANGQTTELTAREVDVKISQQLWTFGATRADVSIAEQQLALARLALVTERQALLLEAAQAHANLRRAHAVKEFALESAANIRQQTGVEEVRIAVGSGVSTDLLQAKTQLAGAQARRVQAQTGLVQAQNRYRAIFRQPPPPPASLKPIPIPTAALPDTLTQALAIAEQDNFELRRLYLSANVARARLTRARRSELLPTVEGSAEYKRKNNVAGIPGREDEWIFMLELSFPLNLGLTSFNTIGANKADWQAAEQELLAAKRTVLEGVRNAWRQYTAAKERAGFLQNQADIAKAFLELAKEERKLGKRSLIDVLSGETSLINAQSDARAAQTDVLLTALGILRQLGRLRIAAEPQ